MRRSLIVFCAVCLCGCSFVTKWTDITSQGRSEAAADADYDACHAKAGYPEKGQSPAPTRAEVMAAAERFKACMTERGWRMDRK